MVALFSAAYLAEVIRGGLQAIPRGQFEAADALGLSYAQKMGLIILPQALKLVIPGIVNTFIGLFKDTSLVLIIGIFDLLGIVQSDLADAEVAVAHHADDGLRVRRPGVLDLLLRHVALFADARAPAGGRRAAGGGEGDRIVTLRRGSPHNEKRRAHALPASRPVAVKSPPPVPEGYLQKPTPWM